MAKSNTIRFACGSREKPASSVWRLIAKGDDVYVGLSRDTMGHMKLSLHASGVWAFSATSQSGLMLTQNNRRARQWRQPPEHAPGATHGPMILIPGLHQELRRVPRTDTDKSIHWYPAPDPDRTAEFHLYFVRRGFPVSWDQSDTELAMLPLTSGTRLYLVATSRPTPSDFARTVADLMANGVVTAPRQEDVDGGSILWLTESPPPLPVPVLVDIPFQVRDARGAA